jgi:hypothetical protein
MRTWGRGSRKYATNYAKDIPVDVGSHIAVYIYPKRQTDADYACRPRINDWEHATYEERLNLSQNNGVDINMVDVDVTDVAQEQLERED